ncbi:hypothetical protein ABJI51_24780 [Amycolatopsis sp. NEAU-NG30]|uniref:Uncharacterized protein n=1 Tax=Amycolatopsis melonis TaxID=3156488 RepID=A0ABV0LLU6_9PSEU
MPRDHTRAAVTALGGLLVALGVAAGGALLLLFALTRGQRDWTGSGGTFAVLGAAAAWTALAGTVAVWTARRADGRMLLRAGVPCLVLGAAPAVAFLLWR